ncbi:hypothetical protein [Marinivivus vitaminiproducens]|uniref:hypothetical protein n=1 Tax=Marinivivus vitaminiproducens TaxID=3035935 RepID=UPI0027A4C595|nr:hypothetical protein P4R82_20745 [Geminicoccaceae bacterium SCSIO 64248]
MTACDDAPDAKWRVPADDEPDVAASPATDHSRRRDGGREAEPRLELLLPDMLPSHLVPTPAERDRLEGVLTGLVKALQHPDRAVGLRRIEELLARVTVVDVRPARMADTGIPAKLEQVDDFDTYFRVDRIDSAQPASSLVRGLLQTSHAVMSLFCRSDQLPSERAEQQIAGFVSYANLLGKTFGLGRLQ